MSPVLSQPKRSMTTVPIILLPLFVFVFVLFFYTFLHESGHVLAGFLFGQTLQEFNVNFVNLDAHVVMFGDLTPSQAVIQSIAGAGLPLLIWLLFIRFVPRKASFPLEVLKLMSTMLVLNTLLAWIIIPVFYFFGNPPADDVTNFLRYSQVPPLILMLIAVILYGGGWRFFLSKIDGLGNEFLLFRTTNRETLTAEVRKTIPVITGILLFCILLTVLFMTSAARSSQFSPPAGFERIAEIDLTARTYPAETLTEFSIEKPTSVGVFIAVRDINTTYFDLSLIGPDGYRSIVLHGAGYSSYQDKGLWEGILPAGTYRLVLTAHQSPGRASVYLRIE